MLKFAKPLTWNLAVAEDDFDTEVESSNVSEKPPDPNNHS